MAGVGAFAGFVSAIIACAVVGAPVWLWVLALLIGPFMGMVMLGMVS
jgi:hypothetical protein